MGIPIRMFWDGMTESIKHVAPMEPVTHACYFCYKQGAPKGAKKSFAFSEIMLLDFCMHRH